MTQQLKESAGDGPGDGGPCLIDCAPLIGLGEEEMEPKRDVQRRKHERVRENT